MTTGGTPARDGRRRCVVRAARSDREDAYSWWCKNQLRELDRAGDR